jgi:Skp family chaperone for outer membrane proteins
LIAVISLCLASAGVVEGAELKIGFIDSERIFTQFKGVQDAQKQFDQDIQTWKAQSTEMKTEIDKMKGEIDSQKLMLSESKLNSREKFALTRSSFNESGDPTESWSRETSS